MILIDGRKAREHFLPILQARIKGLSFVPKLAIIQIGDREDSTAFIKAKKYFAQKIGAEEIHTKLSENISQTEVIDIIEKFNNDKHVQGIIVQLPIPKHLNSDEILSHINSKKDVDGLTDGSPYLPATARGISQLLDFYGVPLQNKKVVVVGRSKLVGTPIAHMCKSAGASVVVCHRETQDIPSITKGADIVIIATGMAKLFDMKYFSEGQVVIDVGISRNENGLVGDVDFENVKDSVRMITPVPGGVGQMTVLALFENLVDACMVQ